MPSAARRRWPEDQKPPQWTAEPGVPDVLLPSCASLDKLLNLSESPFPYKLQRACHHRVPIRAEEGLEELPQHSAGHTIIVSLFLSPPS